MQYYKMISKNYMLKVVNFLNEKWDNDIIYFHFEIKTKVFSSALVIYKWQFEFNIYNIKCCFGCGIELTKEDIFEKTHDKTGIKFCKNCDYNKYKIDGVHPVLKRVVMSNLSRKDAAKLYKELLETGYESKNIILTRKEKK